MKGRLKGLLIFILAVVMSLAGAICGRAASYATLPTTTAKDNGSSTSNTLLDIWGLPCFYGNLQDVLHRCTLTYNTVNGVRVPVRGDIQIPNNTVLVHIKNHSLSSSTCDYKLLSIVDRYDKETTYDLRCGGYGAVDPKVIEWIYMAEDGGYFKVQDDNGNVYPIYIHIVPCKDTDGDGYCNTCGERMLCDNHKNEEVKYVTVSTSPYTHLKVYWDCGEVYPGAEREVCTFGSYGHNTGSHWKVCSVCEKRMSSSEPCDFSKYVCVDNTTHRLFCSVCGNEAPTTFDHNFVNGICIRCNYARKYTLTYNLQGGTGTFTTQTGTAGVPLKISTAKPVRQNYTFKGWSSGQAGVVHYQPGDSITWNSDADITLYAVWELAEYTVTYNVNGGSGAIASQKVQVGSALTITTTKPTRQYYDFKGWSTSASGSATIQPGSSYTPTGNVTLYAIWERSTYTISFDANGGTGTYANVTVTGGNKVTMPSTNPYRTGYNFKGWTDTRNGNSPMAAGAAYTPTKSMTFYAKWEAKKYTITFDKIEPVPASITVTYDQPIGALPTSSTSGWRIAETNENVTSTTVFQVDQNVTLIPRDDKVYVTVTWISDGNATVVQMEKGQKTSPPFIPDSNGGYIFKWWSASSNGPEFNFDNAITSDMTFYAIVEGEKITITFLGIGPKTYTYPQAFGTLPEYSQPGVTFVGWFWDEAMTQKVSPTETVPAYPVTLYPKTEQIKHKLTLPGYGEIMVPEGGAVPDLPTPTKEGETFLGWYTPNGVKIKKGDTVTWTTDMTLTPQFAAVEYMVTMPNGEIRKVYSGQPIGTIPTGSISSGTKVVGFKDQNGNWVDKNTTVTSNMRITAVIERNKCVLTLKDGDKVISTHQVEAGLRVTDLPKQTKDGYTFRGWSTMPGGTVTTGPFYTDTELYPVFSANKQPIYLPDLNQTIEKQTGTKIGGLPIPVKEGYEFDGWLWNGKKVTADTEVPAGGMTLTPSWTKIVVDTTRVVKIRYWSDGIRINTVDMNPGEILYDPGTPALSDLNERLFCYWALSNGSPYTFGVRVNSDLDLYAVWK